MGWGLGLQFLIAMFVLRTGPGYWLLDKASHGVEWFLHFSFEGSKFVFGPLSGLHEKCWGERFVDMSKAYDPRLRSAALRAAGPLRLKCFEGVYAAVPGPQFETPAEIRALKRLGADAVGMSTVPEVTAARQLNMRVLAVALISNRAAGLAREPLRHGEVLAVGNSGAKDLARLLDRLLPGLAA